MRRLTALFILFLLVCTQYARQLAYLHCRWENRATSRCDCEKIWEAPPTHGPETTAVIVTVHIRPDDFVSFDPDVAARPPLPAPIKYAGTSSSRLTAGYPVVPFHPPTIGHFHLS